MAILTQSERIAGEQRIREQLGLPMVGANQTGAVATEAVETEREILGAFAYVFGEIWSRPGLGLRERCFITLSVLATKYQHGPLADYVRASLKVGLKPSEILETMMQASSYCGFTAAAEGMNVARRVFAEDGLTEPAEDLTPVYPMDHEDRAAAMKRISQDCGMGRHGANDDQAPWLQHLQSGVWSAKAKDLPVENELGYLGGQYGYGECWGRATLGPKIRCLITIASLQALFANDQLHFHLNTAVNLGIPGEEIHEALAHAGLYAGIANWRNAANVARDIFLQRGVVFPAD